MAIVHQIIKLNLSLEKLAANQASLNAYLDTLNTEGQAGWQAYHVAEVDDGLLVFLQKPQD